MSETDDLLAAAAELAARNEPMALATVVSVRGSSYRRPGARLLVPATGRAIGLISGGCLEEEAARLARRAIEIDAPVLVTIDHSAEGDELWGLPGWTSVPMGPSRWPRRSCRDPRRPPRSIRVAASGSARLHPWVVSPRRRTARSVSARSTATRYGVRSFS